MKYYNKKIKYVCSVCGSEDIEHSAYGSLKWDKQLQDWETINIEVLGTGYDYCLNCEDETKTEEVEIRKNKLASHEKS